MTRKNRDRLIKTFAIIAMLMLVASSVGGGLLALL